LLPGCPAPPNPPRLAIFPRPPPPIPPL